MNIHFHIINTELKILPVFQKGLGLSLQIYRFFFVFFLLIIINYCHDLKTQLLLLQLLLLSGVRTKPSGLSMQSACTSVSKKAQKKERIIYTTVQISWGTFVPAVF